MKRKTKAGPFMLFLRDLWLHFGPGLLCLIRRRHKEERYVADLVKRGYRGVPIYQCPRCSQFILRNADAEKFGGHL